MVLTGFNQPVKTGLVITTSTLWEEAIFIANTVVVWEVAAGLVATM